MKKTCKGCPFAGTDESDIIQNYGCLPSPQEIVEAYHKRDEAWMCHSETTRVCRGLINSVEDFTVEGKKCTTEKNVEAIKVEKVHKVNIGGYWYE